MRCPEVRDTLPQFLDGRVDSRTRKQLALHLAECEECSRLVNDGKFWDEAVLALLDHEAPPDLRAQILGEAGGSTGSTGRQADLSRVGWRNQLRIMRWAGTRNSSPRQLLEAAAIIACVFLFSYFGPRLLSFGNDDSFTDQGQVAVVNGGQVLSPESPLVSGSLSLAGRLF